ncbi:hypothetical protein RHPLAN_28310 [Rhodoplanes sp. Z2-YC6860]|nr:hypothetical protein RHPLAN_28310 [Rhodoplanes sp. Z2-YC6860]
MIVSDSYIIEVHDEAAGIVVRDRGGFRFFSSDSDFAALDGSLFRDPRAAELAARHHLEGDHRRSSRS